MDRAGPASVGGLAQVAPRQCSPRLDAAALSAQPPALSVMDGPGLLDVAQGGCTRLEPEVEDGNVEYKYMLKQPSELRVQQLTSQMLFRLSEGKGECFYYIGVEDDGFVRGLDARELEASLRVLRGMARSLHASATVLEQLHAEGGRRGALVRVTCNAEEDAGYVDLRIAVAGSVDSGKSTLVAVLTIGADGRPLLDNGRGAARMNVLRHKHELQTGRTSSISAQTAGYDARRRVLNYGGSSCGGSVSSSGGASGGLTPAEISAAASAVATFLDVGGHERCLKTALYGLTCMMPGHMLLCVCAVTGPRRITREHLAVAVALDVPVAVVLTKSDAASEAQMQATVSQVRALVATAVRGMQCRGPLSGVSGGGSGADVAQHAPLVSSEAEAAHIAGQLSSLQAQPSGFQQTLFPLFAVSSVSGAGVSVLHAFIGHLQPVHAPVNGGSCRGAASAAAGAQQQQQHLHNGGSGHDTPVHFQVVQTFDVEGVGAVVSGTAVQGTIEVGQTLMWGPTPEGSFAPITVSCIQRAQLPVKAIKAGQMATLALQPVADAVAAAVPLVPTPASTSLCRTHMHASSSSSSSVSSASNFGLDVGGAGLLDRLAPIEGAPAAGAADAGGPAYMEEQLQQAAELPPSLQAMMHPPELVAVLGGGSASSASQQQGAAMGADAEGPCWFLVGEDGAPLEGAGSDSSSSSEEEEPPLPSKLEPKVPLQPLRRSYRRVRRRAAAKYGQQVSEEQQLQGGALLDERPHGAWADANLAAAAAADADPFAGLDIDLGGDSDGGAAVDSFGLGSGFAFDSIDLGSDGPESPGSGCPHPPSSCGSFGAIPGGPLGFSSRHIGQANGASAAGRGVAQQLRGPPVGRGASAPVAVPMPLDTPAYARAERARVASLAAAAPGSAPACVRSLPGAGSVSLAGTSPLLLGGSPPNWRKGAVLLNACMQPRTSWTFDAVLILLGGHWPPRGLRSRRWPPLCDASSGSASSEDVSPLRQRQQPHLGGGGGGGEAHGSLSLGRSGSGCTKGRRLPDHHHVIHCNGVRQVARVVQMQEVDGEGERAGGAGGGRLRGVRAAAALLLSADEGGGTVAGWDEADGELGSVVEVRFQFLHRPEWLQAGARLLVRERSCSRVAAAGYVRCVHVG